MNNALIEALGWSIIHSLWPCCILALLFAAFQFLVRNANARYAAGCITLLLMIGTSALTFLSIFEQTESVAAVVVTGPVSVLAPQGERTFVTPIGGAGAAGFLAIVVWLWITGVGAMTARSALSWISAQHLKRKSNCAVAEVWQHRLSRLAAQMHLTRSIGLYESVRVQVPAVIGWMRPVILVPAGALMKLTAQELEAVLAHELAHIRRHDYLINLLQTVIETLLFYHPMVWWIGRCVRAEREHCCDDVAVKACGDRLVYARALTSLEELRCGTQFAMAATGGELSGRIRRLFSRRQLGRRLLPLWLLAALPFLLSTLLFVNSRAAHADNDAPAVTLQRTVATTSLRAVDVPPKPSRAPARARVPAITSPQAVSTPDSTPLPGEAAPPVLIPSTPLPASIPAPVVTGPSTTPTPGHAAYAWAQAPTAATTPTPAPTRQAEGYLAGLADAGYTSISIDEIIDLKQNGVNPDYIKNMLHAGFGNLSPKELIKLRNNGVSPEYARAVKSSGIRDADVEGVIRMHQYGVHPELLEALGAAGYRDVTVAQAVQAQTNGLSGSALRSLREQGFKNLTLEQVIKLKRAGVI